MTALMAVLGCCSNQRNGHHTVIIQRNSILATDPTIAKAGQHMKKRCKIQYRGKRKDQLFTRRDQLKPVNVTTKLSASQK